jgi:hypothetical protein
MVPSVDELIDQCDVIVVGNNSPEFIEALTKVRPDQIVIDLVHMPIDADAKPEGYRGLCW